MKWSEDICWVFRLTIRAFLAFELPVEFRRLLIFIFRQFSLNFSGTFPPEKQQKLHITAKFLGDISGQTLADLMAGMKKKLEAPKFTLETKKFGCFGSESHPSVLWAGADFTPPENMYLRQVDTVLRDCHLPEIGNGFTPHITLMRVRKKLPEDFLDKFLSLNVTNLNCEIRSFVLCESKLLKSGAAYRPLLKIQ